MRPKMSKLETYNVSIQHSELQQWQYNSVRKMIDKNKSRCQKSKTKTFSCQESVCSPINHFETDDRNTSIRDRYIGMTSDSEKDNSIQNMKTSNICTPKQPQAKKYASTSKTDYYRVKEMYKSYEGKRVAISTNSICIHRICQPNIFYYMLGIANIRISISAIPMAFIHTFGYYEAFC